MIPFHYIGQQSWFTNHDGGKDDDGGDEDDDGDDDVICHRCKTFQLSWLTPRSAIATSSTATINLGFAL